MHCAFIILYLKHKQLDKTIMKVFEVNKFYQMNWIGDADLKTVYKVIKRTAKTVTVQHRDEIKSCRISVSYDGTEETIYPTGKYSMCPVLRASKEK